MSSEETTTTELLSQARATYSFDDVLSNTYVYLGVTALLLFVFSVINAWPRVAKCFIPRWYNAHLNLAWSSGWAGPTRKQVVSVVTKSMLFRAEDQRPSVIAPFKVSERQESLRKPPNCANKVDRKGRSRCCCSCEKTWGFFNWIWIPWATSELEFIERTGLDGYLLFRTLRLVLTMVVVLFFGAIAALIPTYIIRSHPCPLIGQAEPTNLSWVWANASTCNQTYLYTGDGNTSISCTCGFFATVSIEVGSDFYTQQLVAMVFGFIFSVVQVFFIAAEFTYWMEVRLAYAETAPPEIYSVMVRYIPHYLRSEERLRQFFNELYPGEVCSVDFCPDAHTGIGGKVLTLEDLRMRISRKHAEAKLFNKIESKSCIRCDRCSSPDKPLAKLQSKKMKVLAALRDSREKFYASCAWHIRRELQSSIGAEEYFGKFSGNAFDENGIPWSWIGTKQHPDMWDWMHAQKRKLRKKEARNKRLADEQAAVAARKARHIAKQEQKKQKAEAKRLRRQNNENQKRGAQANNPGATGASVEMTSQIAETQNRESADLGEAAMELEGALQADQVADQRRTATRRTQSPPMTASADAADAQRRRNANDSFESESAQDDATDDDSYDSDFDDSAKAQRLELNPMRVFSDTAFVTFRSAVVALSCSQTSVISDSSPMQILAARQPRDVRWARLVRHSPKGEAPVSVMVSCIFIVLIVGWGFIVFTIGAYTTPESLGCAFGNCTGEDRNPQLSPLLETILALVSPLFLQLLTFLLKPVIQALVNFKFTPFNSMVDEEVFVLFWVFQITNNFLLYSVSATLLADFYVYLAEPLKLIAAIGVSIPDGATFYIIFLETEVLLTLTLAMYRTNWFAGALARIAATCRVPLSRIEQTTTYCGELGAVTTPQSGSTGAPLIRVLFMFLLINSYAVIQPLITIIGVVYALCALSVYTHQILAVGTPKFDSGGLYWPSIYACLMACVIIPQFILLSIVILSGFTELIAAQVAIVVLTLLTAFLIYRPHRNDAKTFPIFVAARIDASRAANKQLRSFEEARRYQRRRMLKKKWFVSKNEDAFAEEMAGTPTFKATDEWHLESQTGRWTHRPRPALPTFDLDDEETKSEAPSTTLEADQVVVDVADAGADSTPNTAGASNEHVADQTPHVASRPLDSETTSLREHDSNKGHAASSAPRPRGFTLAFPDGDAGVLDDDDEEDDIDDHGPLEKQARSPPKRRSSLLSSRESSAALPMTGSRRSRVVRIPPHVWRTTLLESSVGHRSYLVPATAQDVVYANQTLVEEVQTLPKQARKEAKKALLGATFVYDYHHPTLRAARNMTSRLTQERRAREREAAAILMIQAVYRARVMKKFAPAIAAKSARTSAKTP